ncbi:MAG: cofactor-independent phosphoglycerate mutase [Armatimonadetes bacterium]|nr:cofactor-independent phosphoglycerate mutase [Armatimonadota bacterium]
MKYVVVIGDGMADEPVPQLGGRTPLQAAATPALDALAPRALLGMVRTIPEGMPPGSDTANLAVLGYDPRRHYTGRSPFEAASIGVTLADGDVAFRCNLVTLSDGEPYAAKVMLDHSADEIPSEDGRALMEVVNREFGSDGLAFHPGVSYRHLMVWRGAPAGFELTPPHDILGFAVAPHLPRGPHAGRILDLMERSSPLLTRHPVNCARQARGLRPANSIWVWGEGRKPALPSFRDKYGLRGSVISAVDLVKGIGICAGLRSVDVPGATGTLHTDYRGKAMAAIAELRRGQDFVYVHVEAPDEAGHRCEPENKVRAIEYLDAQVIAVLVAELDGLGEEYRLLVLPDHPTPLRLRTHTGDPVPFLLYDSRVSNVLLHNICGYDESSARESGVFVASGPALMEHFLRERPL